MKISLYFPTVERIVGKPHLKHGYLLSNSYLIRQTFQEYCCKSGFDIALHGRLLKISRTFSLNPKTIQQLFIDFQTDRQSGFRQNIDN